MWTVIEQLHTTVVPTLLSGSVTRHLLEDGEQQTVCGEPISQEACEVAVSWRGAADRCPACDQAQGVS